MDHTQADPNSFGAKDDYENISVNSVLEARFSGGNPSDQQDQRRLQMYVPRKKRPKYGKAQRKYIKTTASSFMNLVQQFTGDPSAVSESKSSNTGVVAESSSYSTYYDVVIRYRRGDIGNNDFISHLRAALCRRGLSVDEDFDEVDTVPECRVLIIFLTSTYFSSTLLNIIEDQRGEYQAVYPIFYGLSPSDLISNSKVCDIFFHQDEAKRWQAAMKEITQMPGYTLTDKYVDPCSECDLIDEIVRDALAVVYSSYKVTMVGRDMQIKEILSLLCIESPDVRSIGIWGTVGIGKTAIVEEIFRILSAQYETCVFLKDLHQEVEVKGHNAVGEDFLCKLLEVEPDVLRTSNIKTSFLKSRLERKRVLVILDDVNDLRDVQNFMDNLNYFGSGSRIIITSRNRHVFVLGKINHVYEVKPLDISTSLQLLDRGTLPNVLSPEVYRKLSLELIKFSNGNPQVLQFLSNRKWNPLSEQVQETSPIYIPGIFEASCCGLDDNERSIFLDIACFFKRMDKADIAMLLDSCGFSTHIGFKSLVEKSLLTISHKMVDMHRFLQATGQEIVRQESVDMPGDRSRLCNSKDIMDVFVDNTVNYSLSSLNSLEKLKKMRLSYSYQLKKLPRLSTAPNLELLDLEGCNSLVSISQSICYLTKLVSLNLKDCSKLEGIPSTVDLESLEVLNISGCSKLMNFPEISPNVKQLYMGGTIVQEIPPSIKNLVLLEILDLENSKHLVDLPTSICKLKHLETLNLSGCSSLERFPDLSRKMKCLKSLDLSRTAIKELPSFVSYLTALEELRLIECPNLASLPDDVWSLRFKVEFRQIDTEKFSRLWNIFGWLKKVQIS
ncbi:hypothetical protein YC2023_029240 [Brassica napus]